jgi:ABC-2 type transport system permease protein/sodium transport system permease protein
MNFTRIKTIYFKELIDLLRDRRTVIATIIVPVVLYPMLMLFSVQAASVQTGKVAVEQIAVGVSSREDQSTLMRLLANEPVSKDKDGNLDKDFVPLISSVHWVLVPDLKEAVQDHTVGCGIEVKKIDNPNDPLHEQILFELFVQPDQIRSRMAADRLETAFQRIGNARVNQRLEKLDVARDVIDPFFFKQTNLTTSGSLLGLILPLLLVLITLTSAIYPAIDLTAGERERGTLETLLVCPVPAGELVAGKFLTVVTIALLGAMLNLGSVAATVYFGGLTDLLGAMDQNAGDLPLKAIPIVLIALIPFAVLTSAILLAVCGFARSFKEAQNYITPVILATLLPGMVANLPGTELSGPMLVLPVGNMVLLVRDLLSGTQLAGYQILMVLFSTSLYAGGAVALAAQMFGREAVMFSDNASIKSLLTRRMISPGRFPSAGLACLYVAILFPTWFYVQTLLQKHFSEDFVNVLRYTAVLMPVFFAILPAAMLWYFKRELKPSLGLQAASPRYWISGLLMGLSIWAIGAEVVALQEYVLPIPKALIEQQAPMEALMRNQPLWWLLLVIGLVPAVVEEMCFRGLLLGSLRTNGKRWLAMLATAAAFALFHFLVYRMAITFVLGLFLAYLSWQSRSIWPGMIAHFMNNAFAVVRSQYPQVVEWIGVDAKSESNHLPVHVIIIAVLLVALAIWISRKPMAEPQSHRDTEISH